MVPANLFVVGKAVQSHKASLVTGYSEIRGWRSFDLRTGFYDSESRTRKTFTIRCFLKDHPRWQKFHLPDNDDLVQIQGRLIGRLKHKDARFQYLCCRIEDFTLFGSHPKSEKSTMQGSVKNESQLAKKGMSTDSTQLLQPKSWTARSKSRILQQSPPTKLATLNDITSSSQYQANSSQLPTNNNPNLSSSPKRSHREAFSPINGDDLYTPPNSSRQNSHIPTLNPSSSSLSESPILQTEVISDNEYIPSTQPPLPNEPPRRSARPRKPNSRFLD